ncbi:hypothetical protein HWV62_38398 [Athelia sp. TMB]|nr:hypothetical protein HWV62_38398 [Athelia sp. TMB]
MSAFRSHLTVLESSASRFSSASAFQIPDVDTETGKALRWRPISYSQFRDDVNTSARYYAKTLRADGVQPQSVVGLWLTGLTYTDVLHIYGVSRAGFVPQLFSLRLPNPTVVFELLERAGAKALIHDASFATTLGDSPVPTHTAIDLQSMDASSEPLPAMATITNPDQTIFVLHTSGSTSGSPKLVPCNARWLDSMVHKSYQVSRPTNADKQDVCTWMGSMCHVGQEFMMLGSLQHGSCTIQPTKITFSVDELLDMVIRCRMNRLHQFAAFLAINIRAARQDPKVLSVLQSLDHIVYSGLPLPQDDEAWGYSQGLPLYNLFGSTECGAMLLSVGGKGRDAAVLQALEGVSYGFFPTDKSASVESSHQSTGQMLELVILADSPDCPHTSLRHADGHFHTGDLFHAVAPNRYISRGRDDDWIKSDNGLRCDTMSIEDNVRKMCGNLVEECVVVGNTRPSPTLFIEAAGDMDHAKLKKEIIRKTRLFHSRRYIHERITSPHFIIVVPSKSLPRTATKGNIRRRAVEELFKAELDQVYSTA